MKFIALTYDREAVCGSNDAMFGAIGPFDSYEEADSQGAESAEENGLDFEVLTLAERSAA